MSAAHDIESLLSARFGANKLRYAFGDKFGDTAGESPRCSLSLGWPGLDDVLPDGGLPKGVVELAAPGALGGSTRVALAAIRAGQARGPQVWCAWVDPEATLYAPGVVSAGVDLERMLVVRAPRKEMARVSVKIVGAGAFEVVVIDLDPIPQSLSDLSLALRVPLAAGSPRAMGSPQGPGFSQGSRESPRRKAWAPEVLIRKLALAAESTGATVLLLTDSLRPRSVPWPVALRLELERRSREETAVRVAKDRRGRIGVKATIPGAP